MNTNVGANLGSQITKAANVGMNAVSKAANVGMNSVSQAANVGMFSGSAALVLVVVILVVLFALYYQTVGYYFQLGWEGLGWSRAHGEQIGMNGPLGFGAWLSPAPIASGPPLGVALGQDLENVVNNLESDVESALSGDTNTGLGSRVGKQVFNINRNVYKFSDAEPLCRAFGAELATYDQVKEAYKAGADWCNYGWTKGQLAVYPTQQSTYDKLQMGPESERMSCGVPGVNGGYFPNENQRFGVNCYGVRPPESALDQRLQQEEHSDIAFDREVAKFKAELGGIGVNPWSPNHWSA
jgi:hypothetical protein